MFKGLPSVVGSEFWAVQLYITEYFRHFDNMNAGWDASQTLGTLNEIGRKDRAVLARIKVNCQKSRGGVYMDQMTLAFLTEMGTNLTNLAVKGTVSTVSSKIKAIKVEKDAEIIKNKYDEIINELLSEREEAIRIAQTYKIELDRYVISDEDIQHLHNTVGRVLEIFKVMSPATPLETYEQFKELISVDTLKSMQLLGFNYKAAIGEPLTQLCANAILSKSKNPQNLPGKNKK